MGTRRPGSIAIVPVRVARAAEVAARARPLDAEERGTSSSRLLRRTIAAAASGRPIDRSSSSARTRRRPARSPWPAARGRSASAARPQLRPRGGPRRGDRRRAPRRCSSCRPTCRSSRPAGARDDRSSRCSRIAPTASPLVALVPDRHGGARTPCSSRPPDVDRRSRSAATAGAPTRAARRGERCPATSSSTARSRSTSTRPRTCSSSSASSPDARRRGRDPWRPPPVGSRSSRSTACPRSWPATTCRRSSRDARRRGRRERRSPLRPDDVARRHPEGRLEGRGRGRRPDGRSSRGPRRSRSASAGTATRARSRSSCARRGGSCGWATGSSSPRRRHGFVCANGGVDASNVGPRSGDDRRSCCRSTPTPRRRAIRARVVGRFGVDVPVIVSDIFGRPWRWGIVDVAIGVSGLAPLDDLRGTPDADGRSCARRSGRWPTRSPRPPSSPSASRPAAGRPRPRRVAVRAGRPIADALVRPSRPVPLTTAEAASMRRRAARHLVPERLYARRPS